MEGGRVSSLGALEDTSRKSPDTGISLHRGLFTTDENLESGGGGRLTYWGLWKMEGSRNRASLCKGFHEWDHKGGLLYCGPRKICEARRKWASVTAGSPLLGNMEGALLS